MRFAIGLFLIALAACATGSSQSRGLAEMNESQQPVPADRDEESPYIEEDSVLNLEESEDSDEDVLASYNNLGLTPPPAIDTREFGEWVNDYQHMLNEHSKVFSLFIEKLWLVRKELCHEASRSERVLRLYQIAEKLSVQRSCIDAVSSDLSSRSVDVALATQSDLQNDIQFVMNLGRLVQIQKEFDENSARSSDDLGAISKYLAENNCSKAL